MVGLRVSRRFSLIALALLLVVSLVWVVNSRADVASAAASSTPVVYVATGENFPDALGAGPAAAVNRGPILLVRRTSIPSATAQELSRLDPDRIVVVGGPAVVSSSVVSQLSAWAPVSRIAGTNRYATAAALSRATFPVSPSGSGVTAAGSGTQFIDSANPIVLSESQPTQLVALPVTVPAAGGVLNLTASADLIVPDTSLGGLAGVVMRIDSSCTSSGTAITGGAADLVNSVIEIVPLNASIAVGAGTHTLRLCATALHFDAADTTDVYAARLSAVWTPAAMGNVLTAAGESSTAGAAVSVAELMERLEAMRQAVQTRAG